MNEIAATRRGVHDRLGELPTTERAVFRPGRTLSLRVEFVRQLRRRRTQLAALLLIVLPVIVAVALKVNNGGGGRGGGGGGGGGAGGSALITLGTAGATNFAFYTEFASAAFLLVVIVALFCGDTVASEASWSSLRYLLAIPVPRPRLLRQKLTVALCLSLGANLLVPVWSFLVGGVFFGWAPAQSPLGGSFSTGVGLQRLLIVVAYASVQSLLVATLAFLLSVLTDAPLGAVGGAVLLVVVSNILDAITALGSYRDYLPTHFQYSWLDALGPSVNWDDMIRGTGVALTFSAGFLALAWWRFERKDIVS
ncbi:ABC transporter permease [Allobranchiibius sp. CTAmp26]|uniref:ABC transporter permease n=1 Tax=Allobranchiibius sp. CTAmp26 TaxID=2815214 RepID=UPI001AA0F853|nr:ABC transporter permease [Allobranchiibius sp. CTAmp26]MBO1753665.1 ABC transporter permease [Allobranchiibius sp. CTAmp26]